MELRNRLVAVGAVCFLLLGVARPSSADTMILAAGSNWEYTFANPTVNATWNTTVNATDPGPDWGVGPAPFGNYLSGSYDPAGLFSYKTLWRPDGRDGDDLWVRQAIDLTGFDLNTIRWDLGVDNGYKLYINGTLASNHNAEGYTYRWEYSGLFAKSLLHSGMNVVAVALEDHGGLTAFDMQVHGTAVPAPSALIGILGMSAMGLVYRRARRQS